MSTSKDVTDAYGDSAPHPRTGSAGLPPAAIVEVEAYTNKCENSGMCLIFNNKVFDKCTGQSTRDGTDVDADKIEKTFMRLGYSVTRADSYSRMEMNVALKQAAYADHSNSNSFVCVILSHGVGDYIFARDGRVSVNSILANFKGDNCPTLVGKPKLFFIQACRGTKFDSGSLAPLDVTDSKSNEPLHRMLPNECDLLVAYSVVPGHFSWRNNVDGSWFIQALCRVFERLCRPPSGCGQANDVQGPSLTQILTIATRVVAYDYESCTDQEFTDHMKQMPCVLSMLSKEVYFRPNF